MNWAPRNCLNAFYLMVNMLLTIYSGINSLQQVFVRYFVMQHNGIVRLGRITNINFYILTFNQFSLQWYALIFRAKCHFKFEIRYEHVSYYDFYGILYQLSLRRAKSEKNNYLRDSKKKLIINPSSESERRLTKI